MSTTASILDKPVPAKGKSRFAFLKTKRAIAGLSLLLIISVVLIALGATHEFTPHQNEKSVSNNGSLGDNHGSGNGTSNPGNSTGSGDNSNNNDDNSSGSNNGDVGGGHNSTSSDGNDTGSNNNNDNNDNDNSNSSNNNSTSTTGSDNNDDDDNDQDSGTNTTTTLWQPKNSSSIADGTPLRIMCLGASIIRGEVSSDANGFRKTLRGDLAALGAPINMVGSQRNGDMPDNDFEAYGGNRISQIHDHAKSIVPKQQPNIFVINVGTNNVLQRRDVSLAGKHMQSFIDYLLSTSPRSTVVLSTLLTNTVPNREPLILDINAQFRDLYATHYANTSAVVLAELHPSEGLPGRPTTEDISGDGSHPTDKGYEIMGHILADAVKEADSQGFLRWPEDGLAYDGELGRLD